MILFRAKLERQGEFFQSAFWECGVFGIYGPDSPRGRRTRKVAGESVDVDSDGDELPPLVPNLDDDMHGSAGYGVGASDHEQVDSMDEDASVMPTWKTWLIS